MQAKVMSNKETLRKVVLEELIHGDINGSEAAKKLGVTVRQVKRLKRKYMVLGPEGLIHESRGKTGTRKININIEKEMVQIIKSQYHDFGPTLAQEKLSQIHNMSYSDETVRQIMIRAGIWSRKSRKKSTYFAWRERVPSYGELIQFDGSYHNWFEGRNHLLPEVCLLASIDDATGKITGAEFAANEGIEAVSWFFWKYIIEHGIPIGVYLDKFSTYKVNHPQAVDNYDLMTQFQRMAKTLDMKLITAHTPQAKGRVERLFQTLQDRLVKELRLHNISTIPEANTFLKKIFIPWFNNTYSVVPRNNNDAHRIISHEIKAQLPSIFSTHSTRVINNDFTIQFKKTWYQLKQIQPVTIHKRDKVTLEERLDGTVHIKCKDKYLNAFVLPERPKKTKTNPTLLTTHKLHWKPPADHPWRRFITS